MYLKRPMNIKKQTSALLYCLNGWELREGLNDGHLHTVQRYCKHKVSERNWSSKDSIAIPLPLCSDLVRTMITKIAKLKGQFYLNYQLLRWPRMKQEHEKEIASSAAVCWLFSYVACGVSALRHRSTARSEFAVIIPSLHSVSSNSGNCCIISNGISRTGSASWPVHLRTT